MREDSGIPSLNGRSTIAALTGVRGLGALWVFVFHIQGLITQLFGISLESIPLLGYGYFGVDLFFILSGFVIAHAHYRDFEDGITPNIGRFLTLRVLRIYPLHMITMTAILAFALAWPSFTDWQAAQSHEPEAFAPHNYFMVLFLVQGWGHGQPFAWNATSWSLSVELLAYLAFPFIAYVFLRRIKFSGLNLAAAVALLIGFGLLMAKARLLDINSAGHFGGMARALSGFTAGCLLNRFFVLSARPFPAAWTCTASLVMLMAALYLRPLLPLIYLSLGLLVLSLAYQPRFYGRLVGTGFVFWLGQISFSFYLTGWIVDHIAAWLLSEHLVHASFLMNVFAVCATTGISLLVAMASYRYIELPSRAFGRRIARRTAPASAGRANPAFLPALVTGAETTASH